MRRWKWPETLSPGGGSLSDPGKKSHFCLAGDATDHPRRELPGSSELRERRRCTAFPAGPSQRRGPGLQQPQACRQRPRSSLPIPGAGKICFKRQLSGFPADRGSGVVGHRVVEAHVRVGRPQRAARAFRRRQSALSNPLGSRRAADAGSTGKGAGAWDLTAAAQRSAAESAEQRARTVSSNARLSIDTGTASIDKVPSPMRFSSST